MLAYTTSDILSWTLKGLDAFTSWQHVEKSLYASALQMGCIIYNVDCNSNGL